MISIDLKTLSNYYEIHLIFICFKVKEFISILTLFTQEMFRKLSFTRTKLDG